MRYSVIQGLEAGGHFIVPLVELLVEFSKSVQLCLPNMLLVSMKLLCFLMLAPCKHSRQMLYQLPPSFINSISLSVDCVCAVFKIQINLWTPGSSHSTEKWGTL